ncbi:MAG: YidC/Oxa1 family membrane protein insertase [Candidatus Colwellbacteria bacterium]|nr:YidC/Oxa1 family membrane protein insertase [Candidatus Colwellbacteria bacterium]
MNGVAFLQNLFRETFFFRELFYEPLLNGLVWLYSTVALQDLGLAIILLTVLVRLIIYPLFHQAIRHQRLVQELRPELLKIKDKHKANREAQTKATLELFKHHKLNPLAPFLSLLVQMPVFLALYVIFISDFTQTIEPWLYSFTPHPGELNQTFFNLIDLRQASPVLAILAALSQYFQGRLALTAASTPPMKIMMVYALPAIIFVALFKFPAAIGLYWLTTTVFSIIQQIIVNRASRTSLAKG